MPSQQVYIRIYLVPGTIELSEMVDIIGTLYEMDGISAVMTWRGLWLIARLGTTHLNIGVSDINKISNLGCSLSPGTGDWD